MPTTSEQKGGAPTKEQVYHIDRCLSCLNCKTACPSSVNYQRLVDPLYAVILLRSFVMAAVATTLCLLLAFPLALFISRAQRRRKTARPPGTSRLAP